MSRSPKNDPLRPRAAEEELVQASERRREQERNLSMSERLARVHELCKQISSIAGAAKRR
jgi:hypothetical protein